MNTTINRLLIIALAVSACVVFEAVRRRKQKKQIYKTFSVRAAVTNGDFIAQFPSKQRAIAIRVREILERHLGFKLPTLLPSDEFKDDLKFNATNRAELLQIIQELESEFDIDLPHAKKIERMSVGQLIDLITRKINEK